MALTAVGCCCGAAAFAATRTISMNSRVSFPRPLRPKLIDRPNRVTTATMATFAFEQPPRPVARAARGNWLGFECRIDRGSWAVCVSPVRLERLELGDHRFAVRAINGGGVQGLATRVGWRVRAAGGRPKVVRQPSAHEEGPPRSAPAVSAGLAPLVEPEPEPGPAPEEGPPFSIELDGEVGELFPGAPAQPVPVRVSNPNPVSISVISLEVKVAGEPPSCSSENFAVTPANASEAMPLPVPPEASVSLPSGEFLAPTIAMIDLPRSQDACQGAEIPLDLVGKAVE